MALEYSYDPKARLIRITCSGAISIDDRIHIVRHLLDDPHLPTRLSIMIDVNNVTNAPTNEEIGVIGVLIESLLSRFRDRVAIVNTAVGHVTLSHMVSLSVGGEHRLVQVFASEKEARVWLGS